MNEILQALVSQVGQSAVVQNPNIPNQHNEGVMSEVMSGLMGGLSSQANSQGGLGGLLGLLGNAQNGGSSLMSNPIMTGISQNIIGNIMSKFGINNQAATGVVTSMLPSILGGLMTKVNDPNDQSIDTNGLMGSLSGGRTQGLDLSSLFSHGASAMADGKLDMSDLINIASGQSSQKPGGGLADLLGGFLK